MQEIILDLAANSFIAQGGDRKLQSIQFKARLALVKYRSNLLKYICHKQNFLEVHMAVVAQVVTQKCAKAVGLQGVIFDVGTQYGALVDNVDLRVDHAMSAFQHEYKPLVFLANELRPIHGLLRELRTAVIVWANQHYALNDEDEDNIKDTDMNPHLSEAFVPGNFGSFVDGGNWTPAATLLLLEATGLIKEIGQ